VHRERRKGPKEERDDYHQNFSWKCLDKREQLNMTIIPKGVEHKPVAESEAWIMMIEPKTTTNTGNRTDSDRTVSQPEWI
jgi:hypothetical protein